jgi:segregation and condensation protein B
MIPPPELPDDLTPDGLGEAYAELLASQGGHAEAAESPLATEAGAEAAAQAAQTQEAAAAAPPTDEPPPSPTGIIEALLFVGGEPLTAARACEIVRALTPGQFSEIIDALNAEYRRQGRPYGILAQEHGYVLTLRPPFRSVVEKLYGGIREARLSPAAIDVLALLAYRQPATKSEIDALRGAESGPLLRQLVRRGLATILQRADAERKEVTYGTTPRFLELFGLASLDDLPRTQDLQQI